uniref:SWIM-type domain-containing protein n=1 Tax=Lactuca sativa TaxID=4236 RepID=A0A9R1XD65_LACSA|nr:hypothetical protein LSAT_V11C400161160 [Lactuca sativa]
MGQCRRTKKYAPNLVEGSLVEHYGKLWSNGHEILRTNPGSTVKLDVEDGPDGKKYFSKFYCCFQGFKQGWIEGCRRIIGLDGCFLKGVCKGELLCAIGRDANDKIYPIAWAVVSLEDKQNWKWFLELLIYDLDLNLGNGFTLMLDQHKKRFTGAIYHTLFWRAYKATTEHALKVVMKEIETLNPDAHKYLMEKDPKTWSRAFFQAGRCCDAVENGFLETFNVLPSGLNQLEVRGATDAYEVDLERKTCSCRLWQLNGYGCAHSIASISFLNRDVEAYVDNMFSTTTFRKAYNYIIAPMNSSHMWPDTNYTPPLPLISRRMSGRPTTKRKKSTTENTGIHKVSQARKKIKCSICKEIGHNKATCPQRMPQKLNVQKQKKQKVRVKQITGQGSTSEPQQHEEFEMTPIETDKTKNDMQVTPTDFESSSAGDFSHSMQFTPPRSYEEVVHIIQVQLVRVRPISDILKRIRRRKPERILKLKLGKTISSVNDLGNSKGKAVVID